MVTIVETEGVLGGKPRIAGRRISVQHIAILHERMGQSADVISAELDIDLAAIYAALTYYYDHREAIDARIVIDAELAASVRRETASKLPR
jgi:uncharacterized protein (DUF433 family)